MTIDPVIVQFPKDRDPRVRILMQEIRRTIYDKGMGLSVAAVIGCMEMAKLSIIEDQESDPHV